MFKLRPYQNEAVQATLRHFRQERTPAVVVLPTGAGKSLVIAELARVARGRVLILAHVRELVEICISRKPGRDFFGGSWPQGC